MESQSVGFLRHLIQVRKIVRGGCARDTLRRELSWWIFSFLLSRTAATQTCRKDGGSYNLST